MRQEEGQTEQSHKGINYMYMVEACAFLALYMLYLKALATITFRECDHGTENSLS